MTDGKANKEIASALGVSSKTVEASLLARLVKMVIAANLYSNN